MHYFIIKIDGKTIYYLDEKQQQYWGGPVQWFPPQDMKVIYSKIRDSRGRIPAHMTDLFFIPKWELEEFEKAKDEEELKQLVLKDTARHGCKLIK